MKHDSYRTATRARISRLALASALLVGAGLVVSAQAQLPPVETAHGVQYVTGGFGSDAAAAFKDAKSQYPVALTFAATGSDGSTPYVAEVAVEIDSEEGNRVLGLHSVGPFLLMDLPDGTYTVRATYEGRTQTQQIKVAGPGSVDVRIAWPRAAAGAD